MLDGIAAVLKCADTWSLLASLVVLSLCFTPLLTVSDSHLAINIVYLHRLSDLCNFVARKRGCVNTSTKDFIDPGVLR